MSFIPGNLPKQILELPLVGLLASRGPVRPPVRNAEHSGIDATYPGPYASISRGSSASGAQVCLGGIAVDLLDYESAVGLILEHASRQRQPLGVLSANLDHLNHFGVGGRWEGTLSNPKLEWLTLIDGAPLVSMAARLTGQSWPRLAGSDLIKSILGGAAAKGLTVGFLGGRSETQQSALSVLRSAHPTLRVAGLWAPERGELTDASACGRLYAEIRAAGVDILVVCMGKPRQELWVSQYGHLTGAKVLLAFGAVIDFLAGDVRRAPKPIRNAGLEWAWRLALEPRRLAKRYILDGPEAYFKLRRHSTRQIPAVGPLASRELTTLAMKQWEIRADGFTPISQHTDVAVLVVTYKNGEDICGLIQSLLPETLDQSIKVVVADNSPDTDVLDRLKQYAEVASFSTGGNLGYAGGINAAFSVAGKADAYLILNPDLRVLPGSISVLRASMLANGAGVVVPVLKDPDGTVYPSLRREPTIFRALGDALFGSRLAWRPGWLSEMDFEADSYRYSHMVDWATGAALLVRSDVAEKLGSWDERYFLYSEETDYQHRVRKMSATIWCEPQATMIHNRGGSGKSQALDALLTVNKIRYIEKFHSKIYARAFQSVVVLAAFLRAPIRGRRGLLPLIARRSRWKDLPRAVKHVPQPSKQRDTPKGAVIIPAHNEAAVLGRTLKSLMQPMSSGQVEVLVACNGCNDGTDAVAHSIPDVHVIDMPVASKTAALNAGDRAAERWPRLYVDADIEVPVEALYATLEALSLGNGILCARPAFKYDTSDASWTVRAYYRARKRLPQSSASMWGAGVYGLNRTGHERLGSFPSVVADDCYIDRLFMAEEKVVVDCTPVTVRTPRTSRALLQTLNRVYRGNSELQGMPGKHTGRTLYQLVISIRGPGSALDAVIYGSFALVGRLACGSIKPTWERDESSRR